MTAYLSEFFGMFLLILMGNGVVANISLNKSGMKGAGAIMINISWGLAVMIPAFIFGTTSGAHFNPAVTIALAVDKTISWSIVPGYIIAQFLGAFCGQLFVYIMYKDHFDATENPATVFGCFATRPTIHNLPRNFFCEIVTTFVLMFAIKGISQVTNIAQGISYIYVFGIIAGIGMSFGGLTGFAINPARDLSPRLLHTILPIKNKSSSNWDYAIVPAIAPIIGAVIAVTLYNWIF